jgi:hypothetical protein
LPGIFRKLPFVSGRLSGTPFNPYANIPSVGPHYFSSKPQSQNLRSWPVAGFEAIRIYYLLDEDVIHIVRILHGKRDVERILEHEGAV